MILIDTSIWIDHIRSADELVEQLLWAGRVVMHPFVVGEVALGSLASRKAIIGLMQGFDELRVARPAEVMAFIERHDLHGAGIGYVDAHLLVSTRLTPETALWTRDKRLLAVAERLSLAARLAH